MNSAKILLRVTLIIVLSVTAVIADEGMWRPGQLPELDETLRELGIEIDPSDLTELTDHPMNAVISLGGCTASFVSSDGLAVTNHHCARGAIQYNSTEENNLLEIGFLAGDRAAEIPAGPGSRILVTVETSNVTQAIQTAIPSGAEGRARYDAIEAKSKSLIAECEADEGHRCSVRKYHGGLDYELIKQLEIQDVRLVYAPPGAIGAYGGDIDNWMWPRHTGDYAFYRAYVSPQGKPAPTSDENVPYHPKHHLKVATEDIDEGDFVMVVGYPGTTNRYRLATEIDSAFSWRYPTFRDLLNEWIALIERETADRPDARIKYAGLIDGLSNGAKNFAGILEGYGKTDLLERKEVLEADLEEWLAADPERAHLSGALAELRELVAREQSTRERDLYLGSTRRIGLANAAMRIYRLAREKEKTDTERELGFQERDWPRIRERLVRLQRQFDPAVEREAFEFLLRRYASIPADQHVAMLDRWFSIQGNAIDESAFEARLDAMYEGTGLADEETRLSWLDKTTAEIEASDDPFLQFAVASYDTTLELEAEEKELEGRLAAVRPSYMEALIAYLDSQGKPVYPDANSTLRVTYGSVKGYSPREALEYTPFTTLYGVAEKHSGVEPFNVPDNQRAAIRDENWGRWQDEDLGSVPVNFLSTVDTTGGNSGSPTLNAKAELIGLLFDGNWESILADWDFNPRLTRSIHVDFRYVLWAMDHLVDGGHLLREMGIPPKVESDPTQQSR